MGNFVSVDALRIEVASLLREYPELMDDDVARLDTLEGATDIREVLIRLARALDETKALEEGVHARIAELTARQGRFVSRGEMLRDLIFKVLESANLKKVELPEATLSLRNGVPRLTGEADPASLPDDLVKITRAVDRKKVREAIEAGQIVPGFTLSNAQPSLTVRVK
jgi:Arc/MetJ-type ribon-helix-helix transcriptional regulator